MNREEIRELIELVEKSGIDELEVHYSFGRKIIIRKNSMRGVVMSAPAVVSQPAVPQTTPQPSAPPPPTDTPKPAQSTEEKPAEEEKLDSDKFYEIKAPMVGTFYRKPSPDSEPYVKVGDHIEKGQVVCLIEAMKLFNEVKSEVSGTIKKVLVEDATPVEYGQPLFLVELD